MKKIIVATKAICFMSLILIIGVCIAVAASWITLSDYEFSLWFEERGKLIGGFACLTPLAIYGFVVFIRFGASSEKEVSCFKW